MPITGKINSDGIFSNSGTDFLIKAYNSDI